MGKTVDHRLWMGFFIFLFLHVFSYAMLSFTYKLAPLSDNLSRVHQYIFDPRTKHEPFNLLFSLAQTDAQWYLHIAEYGYPFQPKPQNEQLKKEMRSLSYAFFPVYPLLLSFINFFFQNILVSGLLLAQIFFIINFFSLLQLTKVYRYNQNIFFKVAFLLFFSPFSIFFRAYFSEGVFLFTLIWFLIGLQKKQFILASIFLGLNLVTRPSGWLLFPFFIFYLLNQKLHLRLLLKYICFASTPLTLWLLFNFMQTGSPFFFLIIRHFWLPLQKVGWFHPLMIPFYNGFLILHWPFLPLHSSFGLSKIDTYIAVFSLYLLLTSVKILPKNLVIAGMLLWIFSFCTTTLASFNRYSLMILPVSFLIGLKTTKYTFFLLAGLSFACSLIVNTFFINGYWIG